MSRTADSYVKHLRIAPDGTRLSPAQKVILDQLADDHNEDRGSAWPSVGYLAERACMSPEYCRRLLHKLESIGLLESRPRLRDNGGRSSNEYRFRQIDPPFDAKDIAATVKKMRYQEQINRQQAVQMSLSPPDLLFSPPLNNSGGTPCTIVQGPPELQWSPPLNNSGGGIEPLTEPLGELRLKTPLPPSRTRGDSGPLGRSKRNGRNLPDEAPDPGRAEAVAKVMRECNLSDPRLANVIGRQMKNEAGKTDEPPEWNGIAERMIAARGRYNEFGLQELIAYPVGVRKFFDHGLWRDQGLWAMNTERARQIRNARIGT